MVSKGQMKRPETAIVRKNPFSLKSEVVIVKRAISKKKHSSEIGLQAFQNKCCGWDPNPRFPDVPGLDAPFSRKPYESGALTD